MTDSTPPSIPPRSRPTSPATAGRQTTSSPVRTGTNAAWSGSEDTSAQAPSLNGGSSTSAATVLPPTVTPPSRTSTSSGRSSGNGSSRSASSTAPSKASPPSKASSPKSSGSGSATPPSKTPGPTKSSIRLGDGVTVPPEKPEKPAPDTESPADEADEAVPSPMMVAVDATTAWFKKAGVATTAAFASMTRPRSEEPTMTATPATAPTAKPAPRATTPTENPRPSTGRIPTVSAHTGPRRVRLAISRVDPWSVMKLSLLLSVAIGIMLVVAVVVVWLTLDRMHVFAQIDDLVTQITGQESTINVKEYVEFRRIVSGSMLIAVVDVFILTALATIGAFLYNIVAALVGGVHVTMTDD